MFQHQKPVGPVSKHHVTTKAAAKPHSNSRHNNTATDYNSLPVRNKQLRQETVEPLTHKYPTSRTSKPQARNHRLSATPDQPIRNTQSNSQPDLTKVVMPSFTKRGTVSETESSGSTGSSASSSGSESSEEYQPPLPVKASQVPPTEPPKEHRKLSDQASSVKISNTTKAQVPKFKVPPKEAPVTNVRVSTNGKGKFLNRPELKASSSENDEELSLEKTPRPPVKQLNPPKIPVAIASDSVSASESESGSSYTESTSSDQSPRPATIPQKQQPQKVHARPILAPEPPAPKHTTYTQPPPPQPVQLSPKTSHTVNKYAPQDPQHDINKQSPSYKKRTSIDQPVKEEVPMFSLPQKLELQFSSDNSEEREPSSLPLPSPVQRRPVEVAPVPKENPTPIIVNTPKTPISRFVPPPRPTASHPQYHPPSQLEENESYSMSPNPSVNAESFPGKSDVRLRRQRPSLDLQEPNPQQPPQLRQLPTISSPPPPRPAPSPDKNESPVANRSSKILYGRPQFHNEGQSSRPVSLYRPPGHTIDPENEVSIVSDRSSAHISTGIVIPASPPHNVLGSHEVYRESHIKKPKTNSSKAKEEPAETLSFRDKMKMFAQKNGEEDVTERAKFSSKQRRIESGIYN